MDRVNKILQHPTYKACLRQIHELEAERIFCGHDMAHFLDVARLAYIFNLEEHLQIEKERIYAAALLHDVGRHIQYREGKPHQEAGLPFAEEILKDCGFPEEERTDILEAIARHRDVTVKQEPTLAGIIYRGNKASRHCFGCMAEAECNWSDEKKNLKIDY